VIGLIIVIPQDPMLSDVTEAKSILYKTFRSNAPHHLLSTVHAAALLRVRVLAGPLKRRLARLICIVQPTGCTLGCFHTAGCTTPCKLNMSPYSH